MQVHAVTIVTLLWLTHSLSPCAAQLTAIAKFSQQGVSGTITFTQSNLTSPTFIQVELIGLPNTQTYPWHVHQYPFTGALHSPCSPSSVGGHYDPLGAALQDDYSTICNPDNVTECEIGDLSGKFGGLNSTLLPSTHVDDTLSLYGRHSIVGRSIVIHYASGARFVCANILGTSPNTAPIAYTYVPFRSSNITGNMYIYQYPFQASTVYVNLLSSNPTQDHNWHVHVDPIATGDENGCSSALGHYNPRNVDVTGNYSVLCNEVDQLQCEIGDLSNKGGRISFGSNFYGKLQYTDIDLPIIPSPDDYSIANRSMVIHARNRGAPRVSCANISNITPRVAIAVFDGVEESVTGFIRMTQNSPYDPTIIEVNLTGLQEAASGYHVHVTPIGEGSGITGRSRCSPKYTQGHWNPRGVNYNTDPTPVTLDQYEVGDISGKFGLLTNLTSITARYTDPNLPLFGVDSSIGRSIVVHFTNGSRWACANIVYVTQTNQASALFTLYGHTIELVFIQPANDPYADTTIMIKNISALVPPIISSTTSTTGISTITTGISTSTTGISTSIVASSSSMEVMSSSLSSSLMMSSSPSPSLSFSSSFVTSSLTPSPSPSQMSSSPMSSEISSSFLSLPSMYSTMSTTNIDMSMMMMPSPSLLRRKRFTEDIEEDDDDERLEKEEKIEEEEEEDILFISKRQSMMGSIGWSVRDVSQQQGNEVPCNSLGTVLSNNNDALCMAGQTVACAGGNLVGKHGPLMVTANGIRVVLTDPYLPLSGPNSIVGKSLLVQSEDGEDTAQLVSIASGSPGDTLSPTTTCQLDSTVTTTTTSTSSVASTTMSDISSSMMPSATPTEGSTLPFSQTTLIIICVGGGIAVLLLFLFFLLICAIYCTKRKRKDYDTYFANKDHLKYSSSGASASGAVELGSYTKNPVFSEANYKALYDYAPQQKDDLKLCEGDMVTLIETPAGDWWRGKVEDREGWFPKSYVECIDSIAQVKRRKEDSFAAAAMTIRAASMAFTTSTATPPTTKKHLQEVESTFIIANTHTGTPESSPSIVRSDPPLHGSPEVTTPSPPPTFGASPAPSEDIYIAKFDYQPQGESELELRKGERLIVLERAEGGWWHGMIGEDHGWFPETFVKQENNVPLSPPPPKEEEEEVEEKDNGDFRPRGMTEFHKETSDEVEATEYRAIFAFNSETEGDLNFNEGDIVLVYWANSNGWWFGSYEGKTGYFPGSYVEAVMASVAPSLSPPPEDKQEEIESIEKQEGGGGGGSLSDEISKAFRLRQERSEEREQSPVPTQVPVSSAPLSLSDEITAALKKRSTSPNIPQPKEEDNEPVKSGTTSLSDEITAALKKRSTSPPTATTAASSLGLGDRQETEEERGGDLQSSSFEKNKDGIMTENSQEKLKDENEIDKEKEITVQKQDERPQTPSDDKRQTYRRKAPPPPKASTKRTTSPAPPKVSQAPPTLEQSLPKVSQVPPTLEQSSPKVTKQRPKEVTPIPDTAPSTDKDESISDEAPKEAPPESKEAVIPKTEESTPAPAPSSSTEQGKQKAPPKVVKQLTASPSSRARRVPPPPPSSLATHNKTATTTHSEPITKETTPPSQKESTSPTQKEFTPPTQKELTPPTQKQVAPPTQKQVTLPTQTVESHSLAPAPIHDSTKKSTGWKPQLRKGKQAAPRRAPPQPPPGGSPVVRLKAGEKQRSTTDKSNKPKVQIVRRPTARSIPPPPSIPLPPPPTKSTGQIPPAPTSPLPPPPPPPPSTSLPPPSRPSSRPPQPKLSTIEEPIENSSKKEASNEVPARPSRPTAPPKAHDYETPISFVENKEDKSDHKVVVPAPRKNKKEENKPHDYEKPVSVQDKKEEKVTRPLIVRRQSKVQDTPSHDYETPIPTQKEENKDIKTSQPSNEEEVSKEESDLKPLAKPKPPPVAKKPSGSLTPKSSPKVAKPRPPKPTPPVRNSSLPSTPQGSPSPSPSLPHKTLHSPSPSPLNMAHSPTPPTDITSPNDTPINTSPTPPKEKSVPPPRPNPPPPRKTSTEQLQQPEHTKPVKVEYPVPASRRRSRDVTNKAQPPSRPQAPPARRTSQVAENSGKYFKATKSHKTLEGSDKLSFNIGDTLVATDKPSDRDGWIHGMLDDGTTGLFPLSHVTSYQPSS